MIKNEGVIKDERIMKEEIKVEGGTKETIKVEIQNEVKLKINPKKTQPKKKERKDG